MENWRPSSSSYRRGNGQMDPHFSRQNSFQQSSFHQQDPRFRSSTLDDQNYPDGSSSRHGSAPPSRHGSRPSSRHGSRPSPRQGSGRFSRRGFEPSSRHNSGPSRRESGPFSRHWRPHNYLSSNQQDFRSGLPDRRRSTSTEFSSHREFRYEPNSYTRTSDQDVTHHSNRGGSFSSRNETTPEPSGHRLNLYPVIGMPVVLANISNESRSLDIAKSASKELATIMLQDPEQAKVEILPTNLSPRKVILTHPEWMNHSFALKSEVKRSGLLAIRILSDAFFYKCGYGRSRGDKTEQEELENLKQNRAHNAKLFCVFRNAKRLLNEAQITKEDLQLLMRLSIVVKPVRLLDRLDQNHAAHTSEVGLMAYQLQRAFRAYPNQDGERVIGKVFSWICGKSIQAALDDQDERLLTRTAVYDSERQFWLEEIGIDIDTLYDDSDEGEEVGRFFDDGR